MPAELFGYVSIPFVIQQHVRGLQAAYKFETAGATLAGSGSGQRMLLHKIVKAVAKKDFVHDQTIGDCVSHGWGLAVDILRCVQLFRQGLEANWNSQEVATEAIYALSRVEIGGGQLGSSDGSTGVWASRAVEQYGVLLRKIYQISPSISWDLSNYSGSLASQWGRANAGLPDTLEPIARQRPVRRTLLVTTYEEARDAIFAGFPVAVCSMQGFASSRDSKGFAAAQGSWAHCMCFIGMDDESPRKGLLCMNSWGPNWISGPKTFDQPDGSFWVDKNVADAMLRGQDSYAVCDVEDPASITAGALTSKLLALP